MAVNTHESAAPEARTTSLIIAARALRDFGDGFVAVLLPVYLTVLGLDAFQIGVASTAALLGSALMTLTIGLRGARVDQRLLLMAAAGLMLFTGVAFASADAVWAILLIAALGTVNPSAGSVSIFAPLEHAVLSRVVADAERTRMFARYSLTGALAAAAGALAAASPDLLARFGIGQTAALKAMFIVYAALGALGGLLYWRLPASATVTGDTTPVALGPSRRIVYRLAALFSIDSFAGGFAV